MIYISNKLYYGVIYIIKNKINNKVYVGQTTNKYGFNGRYNYKGVGIERVYNYYKTYSKHGRFVNNYLFNSIIKYGINNFEVIEVFDKAVSKFELDMKEIHWINYFDSVEHGYNNNDGGSNGMASDETRHKLSIAAKNRIYSDETRNKISKRTKGEGNPMYGKRHSNESKEKIKLARSKINISGENNPMYGTTMPDYVKDSIIKANSKKVILLNTLEVFDSQADAVKKFKSQSIYKNIQGKNSHGGYFNDGEPMIWMDYDKYLNSSEKEIYFILNKGLNKDYRVINIDTGEVFNNNKDVKNNLGIDLVWSQNTCGGYHWCKYKDYFNNCLN